MKRKPNNGNPITANKIFTVLWNTYPKEEIAAMFGVKVDSVKKWIEITVPKSKIAQAIEIGKEKGII